jgi:MFS family permease
MSERDKRNWIVVGVLFAAMFFVWGPVNAGGVFFLPVITHFGWSRAFFSSLVAAAPLAGGLSSPLIGSMLDRVRARNIMVAGAAMVALSYLGLSRANSPAEFLVIFILIGIGISAATIIPSAVVITNLFREQRGLALGIVFSGIPLGGTGITIVASRILLRYGFRVGYAAMAVPIVLVLIPLIMIFLDVPLASEARIAGQVTLDVLPGLEVREAIRGRSFWMIAVAEVFAACAGVGLRVHLIPYLTGIGYTPTLAARLFGAMFLFSAVGTFLAGRLADRMGGRRAVALMFLAISIGIASLLAASHLAIAALFVVLFGLVRETPAVLLPLVIGESLGVRRLGTLLGIQGLFTTFGFAAGPVIAGRIFDVYGSYSAALVLFAAMALIACLAIRATLPLAEERARFVVEQPAVA